MELDELKQKWTELSEQVEKNELHKKLLKDTETPEAKALIRFFDKWDPDTAKDHPALAEDYEDIIASSNLVFRMEGRYLHENTQIRDAWMKYYQGEDGKTTGVCLVTGETGPVVLVTAINPTPAG